MDRTTCSIVVIAFPFLGAIFNTASNGIAGGVVIGKFQSFDWLSFFEEEGTDADNFSTLAYIACGATYGTVLVHALQLILFRCGCIEKCTSLLNGIYAVMCFGLHTASAVIAIMSALRISQILNSLPPDDDEDFVSGLRGIQGGLGALAAFSILGSVFYFAMLMVVCIYSCTRSSYEKL